MTIPTTEHKKIEAMIDCASNEEIAQLRNQAESLLDRHQSCMKNGQPSPVSNMDFEIAVETLVRIEAKEQGKGFFFRAKRRMQITAKYML